MSDKTPSGRRPRAGRRGRVIAAVVAVLVIAAGAVTAVVLSTDDGRGGNGTDTGKGTSATAADGTLDALVSALQQHDAAGLRKIVCVGVTGNAALLKSKADLVAASVTKATKTRAATEHGAEASGTISVVTRGGAGEQIQGSVIRLAERKGAWCVAGIDPTTDSGHGSGSVTDEPSAGGSPGASGAGGPSTHFSSPASAFDALVAGLDQHDTTLVSRSVCAGSALAGDVGAAVRGAKSATVVAAPRISGSSAAGTIHVMGYGAGQAEDAAVTLRQLGGGWCVEAVKKS